MYWSGNLICNLGFLRDTCCKKLYKMLQVPYFSGYLEHFSYESAAGAGRTLNRADNHFSFLCWYRRKAPEWLAIPLNYFLKHSLWSYPYTSFAVHRLIYDHLLKGFRMLCYVKDTIDVALEMSVVLFHGFKDWLPSPVTIWYFSRSWQNEHLNYFPCCNHMAYVSKDYEYMEYWMDIGHLLEAVKDRTCDVCDSFADNPKDDWQATRLIERLEGNKDS